MNGTEPKIEIFAPFSAALDLMKKILFQPFDLAKWCVIGFAAFLANLSGGIHGNFPGGNWDRWRHHDWHIRRHEIGPIDHTHLWLIPFIIVGVIVALAIIFVLMWVGARGRFIFTDCIARNRAAIVAPWHEFRQQGNSFFLFSLLFVVAIIAILMGALFPLFLPRILHGGSIEGAAVTIALFFWVGLIVILALAWALISHLMVPVMYRRRCLAREAFSAVVSLISANLAPIVLYCLFFIVLALACAMIGCIAACVTCCIAAIPYVGTVILLPIHVTLAGFTLLFLRQFGPDYDVWAGVTPIEAAPPTSSLPPPIPPSPPIQS